MAYMTSKTYEHFKDIIHPNFVDNIEHYRDGDTILLPQYHGCYYANRNGTRKEIDYARGHQFVLACHEGYWKKNVKSKYKRQKVYMTRYMSNLGLKRLAKTKEHMWCNWRLKKFIPKFEWYKKQPPF